MQIEAQNRNIKDFKELKEESYRVSADLSRLTKNGIRITDNFDAVQVTKNFAAADTEYGITHTLGRAPTRYIVDKVDAGAVIYDSGTAWTSTTIYLKASAICNATITVM